MTWMNTWEIDEAFAHHVDHPILGPATRTLAALRDCADQNSDGWCYWPKPANAAAKLMQFIQYTSGGTLRWRCYHDEPGADATEGELRACYRPIRAFRTRSGLDFRIFEPGETLTSELAREQAEAAEWAARDVITN